MTLTSCVVWLLAFRIDTRFWAFYVFVLLVLRTALYIVPFIEQQYCWTLLHIVHAIALFYLVSSATCVCRELSVVFSLAHALLVLVAVPLDQGHAVLGRRSRRVRPPHLLGADRRRGAVHPEPQVPHGCPDHHVSRACVERGACRGCGSLFVLSPSPPGSCLPCTTHTGSNLLSRSTSAPSSWSCFRKWASCT